MGLFLNQQLDRIISGRSASLIGEEADGERRFVSVQAVLCDVDKFSGNQICGLKHQNILVLLLVLWLDTVFFIPLVQYLH